MRSISEIPKIERPREKLLDKGVKSLSDLELLAIMLGTGIKGNDVMSVANRILKLLDRGKGRVDAEELMQIEGVGPAKATVIAAALEFAGRRIRPEGIKVVFPTDVMPLISHMSDRKQEHFICISLNGASEVIATRIVTVGLVNMTQVHPREVFADPITDRATGIIIAHNHPSGSLTPSRQDMEVTKLIKEAGEILGIRLVDHIIFNTKGYFSFLEEGKL